MNTLFTLSVVVGAITYLYIIIDSIIKKPEDIKGLSFATFFLWASITWIIGACIVKDGGWKAAAVPFIYATGATALAVVLTVKKKTGWNRFDSIVTVLVVISMYLFLTEGTELALYFSVGAAVFAALPLIGLSWALPAKSAILTNAGFLTANILSCIAAKSWLPEDRLYPIANIGVCALLVAPWVKYKLVSLLPVKV